MAYSLPPFTYKLFEMCKCCLVAMEIEITTRAEIRYVSLRTTDKQMKWPLKEIQYATHAYRQKVNSEGQKRKKDGPFFANK